MSTKNTTKKATAKKAAAKRPAKKRATAKKPATNRLVRRASVAPELWLPRDKSADLALRWPSGTLDTLPEDARPVVIAIERLVAGSTNPRKAINQLRSLVTATRNSALAGFVAELRLSSYRKGFIEGFITYCDAMGNGGRARE